MLLNLKCIVLPLLALFTVNTVLSAWAAESLVTKDGASSAIGTVSTIGTFENQQHHRRWRRGSAPGLGSLGRGAFGSKSGQRVAHDILPTDGTETDKKPNWLRNFKRVFKPASRYTHDEVIETIQKHQLHFSFAVVFAQNVKQLHKQKELLKAALFYEQTLNLFTNEVIEQEDILQKARDHLKFSRQRSVRGGVLKSQNVDPEKHVEELEERVGKLRDTKREIKDIINKFGDLVNDDEFNFGKKIKAWESVRNNAMLNTVLKEWERKKPDEWDKEDLEIWMKNNTTSEKNAHPLLQHAIKIDTMTKKLVDRILLVDAALDREARNLCLNAAFVVPMRNWASISQKMTDEQIEKYVTNVLGDNFLGLHITFNPDIGSTFIESKDDFKRIEEPKKRNKLKTFKRKIHNTLNPYSSRGPETHLKQLEAKNTKLSWDILKAMNREDRIKAKEAVKLAVYLMMSINIAHSNEVEAKIEEAKKAVAGQSRALKDAEKKHKHAHRSGHNSQDEHSLSRSSSRRRPKRSHTDENGQNGEDGESNDDGENGENNDDGESNDDGQNGEHGESNDDGENGEDVESDEEVESDEDVENDEDEHFDNDEEEQHQDFDQSSGPQMFGRGSFKRSGKERHAMSPIIERSHSSSSSSSNRSTFGHNSCSSRLEKCPTKRKVIEKQVMLAKSKSHRDELVKSQKAVKNSRQYLHLQRSKSGKGFFAVSLGDIKAKANGNEVYKVINEQLREIAKQQLPENRLNDDEVEELVENHMREVFAEGPGKQFLLNMIELSKQMTEFEIRQWPKKFRWFPGCNVQINDDQIAHNGSGINNEDDEPRRPRSLARSASAASTSSTQRRADGSRLKSKSTRSGGKRDHKRR